MHTLCNQPVRMCMFVCWLTHGNHGVSHGENTPEEALLSLEKRFMKGVFIWVIQLSILEMGTTKLTSQRCREFQFSSKT